jgi:hypothetical protein
MDSSNNQNNLNNNNERVTFIKNLLCVNKKTVSFAIVFPIVISILYMNNYFTFVIPFLLGIIFTLILQIFLIMYFFGLKIVKNDENAIDSNINQINTKSQIYNILEEEPVPEEENINDLRITYKTLLKKSPRNSLRTQEINEIHNINFQSGITDNTHMNFNIDQNYYCFCKFSYENFLKIIKLRNDKIQSYFEIFLKYFTQTSSVFKNLGANFKTFHHSTLIEENTSFNCNIIDIKVFNSKYNNLMRYFSTVCLKFNDASDVITKVIITNLKGISLQSQKEIKETTTEINLIIKDINEKEKSLQIITDKYINQKGLIEKLSKSHESAKLNDKYEIVVKYEMDLKIAMKGLSEIQSSLSSKADEYKELKSKFAKKSLMIYINFLKILNREYEVIKALLLSYFETIEDCIKDVVKANREINGVSPGDLECLNEEMNISLIFKENKKIIETSLIDQELLKKLLLRNTEASEKFKELQNLSSLTKFFQILKQMKFLGNVLQTFTTEIKNLIKFYGEENSFSNNSFISMLNNLLSLPNINPNGENGSNHSIAKYFQEFYSSSLKSITKYFSEVESFSKELSSNEHKVNEITKKLKDEFSIAGKLLDNNISNTSKELKNIFKEKNNEKQLLICNKLIDNFKNDNENMIPIFEKIEILKDEVKAILYTNYNVYQSAIFTIDSDLTSGSWNFIRNFTCLIENANLNLNIKKFFNIELTDDNFEKIINDANNEIIEFLSVNGDRLDITHERKCPMHHEIDDETKGGKDKDSLNLNVSHNSNQTLIPNSTPNKSGYISKVKEYIINKLKKTQGKSKEDLFKNIDQIISDKSQLFSDLEEKLYENYQASNNENIYNKKEEATWFNQLLHTFFNKWKENNVFKHGLKRYLYRIYNKKRPDNLDTIYVDDVKVR